MVSYKVGIIFVDLISKMVVTAGLTWKMNKSFYLETPYMIEAKLCMNGGWSLMTFACFILYLYILIYIISLRNLKHLSSPQVLGGARVTQSSVLCVVL